MGNCYCIIYANFNIDPDTLIPYNLYNRLSCILFRDIEGAAPDEMDEDRGPKIFDEMRKLEKYIEGA